MPPSILWLYAAGKALGMKNIRALTMTGMIVALPVLGRFIRLVVEKTRPSIREIQILVHRCVTGIRARLTQAAREITAAVGSVVMTLTTLAVMWSFFVTEVVTQFIETLRETVDVTGNREEEEFQPFPEAA